MSAGEQLGAGNLTKDADATPAGLVEQHHIEPIPESDRHGRGISSPCGSRPTPTW